MPEPDDDSGIDEVVDVICVGTSPGVLAYAISCAAADLDVLIVDPSVEPDQPTAAWYAAMTEDLGASTLNPGRENTPPERPVFSFARVTPPPAPAAKRAKLEPFVGERLQRWSAHCLRSPFGVMFSQVPEILVPMRTEDGESITAAFVGSPDRRDLSAWLADCASEHGLAGPANTMSALIVEQGQIVGVQLDGGYRIAAADGLAVPVGSRARVPDLPEGYAVAVVGRPAGRFATLDLLKQ
ncbi:MAG: hypothetical protein FGM52_08900 [Mycobacterium sp.]|nr:hypothetical protein [Mycobacterium sp.]